jgi:hypothetical protein
MKTFLTLLLTALCATISFGQTIKSLGYNTTNGQVVYSGTNTLTFTNAINVGADITINEAGITGYGSEIDLEERDLTAGDGNNWQLGGSGFSGVAAISFANTTNAATTRTNLGLGLPALTNTSNITTMRALAGSTNTNEPFNGQFEFKNATDDVYTATVSNGIILSVQEL